MRYSPWKYLLILVVVSLSTIYALPSLYPDEPAVQISGVKASQVINRQTLQQAEQILNTAGIPTDHESVVNGNSALIGVKTSNNQLKAQDLLRQKMGDDYVVALNLAETTPKWLQSIHARPMKLGLDLRGGVHFLMQVDMAKMLEQRLQTTATEVRKYLRSSDINFSRARLENDRINIYFNDSSQLNKAQNLLRVQFPDLNVDASLDSQPHLVLSYTEAKQKELSRYAVDQNLVALRNRINELGVSEAVVQAQGANRIVIDLPGIQDTAAAKRVIGRTANLEFRMVADPASASPAEPFPFKTPDGPELGLARNIILTGDRVTNAQSGMGQDGLPNVSITLDSAGGKMMAAATRESVGKQMAVLFIENKQKINYLTGADGKTVEQRTPYTEKVVINQATIQSVLGSQFQISGLDNPQEAAELALLLRSGALAAPMYFVEERAIGPSLGQENIEKGVTSTIVGYALVALFMLLFYRLFGVVANIALIINLAMILAIMSLIGAAITLPGIAGIVLTIGMAVDANVLIFERIREELRLGARPRSAINAGFDRAYGTILDANVTTLIVAFVLFMIGTGPIKGFAITLTIGLLCSMFTAITVSRAIIELIYGRKKHLETLKV